MQKRKNRMRKSLQMWFFLVCSHLIDSPRNNRCHKFCKVLKISSKDNCNTFHSTMTTTRLLYSFSTSLFPVIKIVVQYFFVDGPKSGGKLYVRGRVIIHPRSEHGSPSNFPKNFDIMLHTYDTR